MWKSAGDEARKVVSRAMKISAAAATANADEIAKGTGTEAPAKFVSGDTALLVQEDDTSKERRIAPASPKAGMGSPSPAVRRSLFVCVDNGPHFRRPRPGARPSLHCVRTSSTEPDACRRMRLP